MADPGNRLMNAVVRIQNVILDPISEWTTISQESISTKELYSWHVIPLAAIGPAASFMASSFDVMSKVPVAVGVYTAIVSYVFMLLSVYILALIVTGLTVILGDEKNEMQALQITAYAYTPAWLASILYAVPFLELVSIFGSFYAVYLFHVGISVLMKVPAWKAFCYALVVTIGALALAYVPVVISKSTLNLYRSLQAGRQQERPAAPLKPQVPKPPATVRRDVPRAAPYQVPSPTTPEESSRPPVEVQPPLIRR
ncbi:MAG: Yip1 family protein [Pseudomonadota bacterium]